MLFSCPNPKLTGAALNEFSKRASRMSFRKKNQNLLHEITDQMVAKMVSEALRQEYQTDSSVIKRIGIKTGFNTATISKWYQARNAPKSSHLIVLAAMYPAVIRGLLELLGFVENCKDTHECTCWTEGELVTPRKANTVGVYGDISVNLDLSIPISLACNLNIRQLWFLNNLQIGLRTNAPDIAKIWKISLRTSKRDLSRLMELGLIKFTGTKKTGYYSLI